eukprot:3409836-Rhodomonas_salina.2
MCASFGCARLGRRDLNKDNVNSCLRAGQRPGKYSSARGGATRKSIRTSVRERSVWLRPIAVLH